MAATKACANPVSLGRTLYTVPTALERQGDFSQTYLANGSLDVIYNPFTTTQMTDSSGSTCYTRTPYPGNKLPGGLHAVGQKLASLYPLPNLPGTGSNHLYNFQADPWSNTSNDKFDVRVDWA